MPTFNEFVFEVFANENNLELTPGDLSFSMIDSIYNFYPRCIFNFFDVSGLIFEGKAIAEGMSITLHLGTEDYKISCDYVMKKNQLPDARTPGYLNGEITGEVFHTYSNQQEEISFSYTGAISLVIEEVIEDFSFRDTIIEETANDDIWYRPLLTQKQFIEQILMPCAYSYNSEDTPFFCFIDSNNVFHFETFNTLINKEPSADLEYKPRGENDLNEDMIFDIKPFSPDIKSYYKFLKRKIYYQSQEDGSLVEEDDSFLDHPPNRGNKLPYIGDSSLVTGTQFLDLYEEESPENEQQMAEKIYPLKNALILERALIVTPLRVDILAGQTINIKTIVQNPDDSINSLYFSGKYLVEKSSHVWDKDKKTGHSEFVIGRRYVKVPDSYLIRDLLYS